MTSHDAARRLSQTSPASLCLACRPDHCTTCKKNVPSELNARQSQTFANTNKVHQSSLLVSLRGGCGCCLGKLCDNMLHNLKKCKLVHPWKSYLNTIRENNKQEIEFGSSENAHQSKNNLKIKPVLATNGKAQESGERRRCR